MTSRGWEEDYLSETECRMPKWAGRSWFDVIQQDRRYVRWVVENVEGMDEDLRDALEWGVDHIPDRI